MPTGLAIIGDFVLIKFPLSWNYHEMASHKYFTLCYQIKICKCKKKKNNRSEFCGEVKLQMLVKSCEFCEICNFIKLVKVGVDQGLIKLERSVLKQLPRVSDFSIEFPF